jgi:hypothetical protein
MEPKLGLLYNGAGINGPVGHGWSVQGISMITRCPLSQILDGRRGNVQYKPTDKLCLDGQRLIPTDEAGVPSAATNDDAGGVSAAYREYRTEKDTYARVRAYGSAAGLLANGPSYFKVWTKNGQIYEYGNTDDSRIEAQGKTVVMTWAVNRISDTLSNYIDFKYEEREVVWGSGPSSGVIPGKEWNLLRILYTGRSAAPVQAPAVRVDFYYEDRPNNANSGRSETYHQGSKNVSVRLLKEVRTWVNQQAADPLPNSPTQAAPIYPATSSASIPVKVYKLNYDLSPNTQRNRLTKVQECAGRNPSRCMPAHQLTYSNGGDETYTENPGFNLQSVWMQDKKDGNHGILTGDFDGDGKTDIIKWGNTAANNQLYLSRPSDSGNSLMASFQWVANFNITQDPLGGKCVQSYVLDINGDGKSDILRYGTSSEPHGTLCFLLPDVGLTSLLFLSQGDGTFTRIDLSYLGLQKLNMRLKPGQIGPIGELPNCPAFYGAYGFELGDFNGDGLPDIVKTYTPSIPGDPNQTDPSLCPPMNGCPAEGCNRLFLGSVAGTFAENSALLPSSYRTQRVFMPHLFGSPLFNDINDDSKTDLVRFVPPGNSPSNQPSSFLSSASDWTEMVIFGVSNFTARSSARMDFNGDRREDYLSLGQSQGAASLYSSLGGEAGFTTSSPSSFNLTYPGLLSSSSLGRALTKTDLGDFNGDGRSDVLRTSIDPSLNRIWLSNGDGSFRESASFLTWATTYALFNSVDPQTCTTQECPSFKQSGNSDFVLGDFTGRGQTEILRIGEQNTEWGGTAGSNRLLTKVNSEVPDQLMRVVGPSGAVSTVQYQWLSADDAGVYAKDSGANAASYPLVDVRPPLSVVASITTDSGVGSTAGQSSTTQRYYYRGMKASYDGRGQLGFRQVQREFQGPNGEWLTATTDYFHDYPLIGTTREAHTRRGTIVQGGAELSRTVYTYCDRSKPQSGCPETGAESKVRRPYVRQTVQTTSDLSGIALPSVTTVNTYNDLGDPLQVDVTTSGTVGGQAQTFTKRTVNTYAPPSTAGESWILGRLTQSQVTSTVPNALLSVTAGSAPNATATQGTTLTAASVVLSPASIDRTGPNPGSSTGTTNVTDTVSVQVNGGLAPHTYTWARSGGTTTRINVSPNGSQAAFSAALTWGEVLTEQFTVTVRDAVGTQVNKTLSVTFRVGAIPAAPAASIAPNPVTGSRSDPGVVSNTVTVSVSGGQAPFTYNWVRTGGSTNVVTLSNANTATATFSANLNWGASTSETFQVTVTDALNRTTSASTTVALSVAASPTGPTVSASPAALSASRADPGTLSASTSITASGGVAPLSYSWLRLSGSRIAVSGTTSSTFSASLNWGETLVESFRMTVTDALNRSSSVDVTVTFTTPAAPPSATATPNPVTGSRSRPGLVSATATANVGNGQAPFTYSWVRTGGSTNVVSVSNANAATATFSANLGLGASTSETFQVTVTDALSRTASASTTVNFSTPTAPSCSVSPANPSVTRSGAGALSTTAAVNASGGTGGYSYSWSRVTGSLISVSGAQSATFTATLAANTNISETFRATVTDSAGNATSCDITVNFISTPQLTVTLSPSPASAHQNFSTSTVLVSKVVNATITGGSGSYTSITWAKLTSNLINVSGAQTATFSLRIGGTASFTDVFRITVTDSLGGTATADVQVTLSATYLDTGCGGVPCP